MKNQSNPHELRDKLLFIDEMESSVLVELMIRLDGFISIEDAEKITTLDKTTQYRQRRKGHFPIPIEITASGRRKAYRVSDIIEWLNNPVPRASE